jgi:hypothetical protein
MFLMPQFYSLPLYEMSFTSDIMATSRKRGMPALVTIQKLSGIEREGVKLPQHIENYQDRSYEHGKYLERRLWSV